MDSKEMKNALKTMAQFAPALARASEILEAAEAAEAALAAQKANTDAETQKSKAIKAEIESLSVAVGQARADYQKTIGDLSADRDNVKRQVDDGNKELANLARRKDEIIADLTAARVKLEEENAVLVVERKRILDDIAALKAKLG